MYHKIVSNYLLRTRIYFFFLLSLSALCVYSVSGFALYIDTGLSTQNVDDCGILSTTNAVYTLTQNITANDTTDFATMYGVCINITASGITLNGASYTIRNNYTNNLSNPALYIATGQNDVTVSRIRFQHITTTAPTNGGVDCIRNGGYAARLNLTDLNLSDCGIVSYDGTTDSQFTNINITKGSQSGYSSAMAFTYSNNRNNVTNIRILTTGTGAAGIASNGNLNNFIFNNVIVQTTGTPFGDGDYNNPLIINNSYFRATGSIYDAMMGGFYDLKLENTVIISDNKRGLYGYLRFNKVRLLNVSITSLNASIEGVGGNSSFIDVMLTSSAGSGVILYSGSYNNFTNVNITSANSSIYNVSTNNKFNNISASSSNGYGIYAPSLATNTLVANSVINSASYSIVNIQIIENNTLTFTGGYAGLHSDQRWTNNTMIASGTYGPALYAFGGTNITLNNNNIRLVGSLTNHFLHFTGGGGNQFTIANNTISVESTISGSYPAAIYADDYLTRSTFFNNTILINTTSCTRTAGIYLTSPNTASTALNISNNNIHATANCPTFLIYLGNVTYSTISQNTLTSLSSGNTLPLIQLTNVSYLNASGNLLYSNYSKAVNLTTTPITASLPGTAINFTPTNLHNGLPITNNYRLRNYVINGSNTLNPNNDIVCNECYNVTYDGFNLTNAQIYLYGSNYTTINNSYFREYRSVDTATFINHLSVKSQFANSVINTTFKGIWGYISSNFTIINSTIGTTASYVADYSSCPYALIQDTTLITGNYGFTTGDDIIIRNVQLLNSYQNYLTANSQLINVNITMSAIATTQAIKSQVPSVPLSNMAFTNVIINTPNSASMGIDLAGGTGNNFTNVIITSGSTAIYNVSHRNSFENVTLNSSTGIGIDANSASYINITNSIINTPSNSAIRASNFVILENNTLNASAYGAALGSNVIVRNNTFVDQGSFNADLTLYRSQNDIVTLNRFLNVGPKTAISMGGDAVYPGRNTTITNNVFNTGTAGVGNRAFIYIDGSPMSNTTIANNSFSITTSSGGTAPQAIVILPTTPSHNNFTISNNTIFANTPYYLPLINISNTQNSTIYNNTLTTINSANTAPLIYVYNSSRLNFSANRLYGNYSPYMYTISTTDFNSNLNSFTPDNYANGYQITYGYNLRNVAFNGSNSSTPEPIVCYYCSNVTYYNYRLSSMGIVSLSYSNQTAVINSTIGNGITISNGQDHLILNVTSSASPSVSASSATNISILNSSLTRISFTNTDNSLINGSIISVTGGNSAISLYGNNNQVTHNLITVTSSGAYGIIENNYNNNNITDNVIIPSSLAEAVYFLGGTNNRLYRNNITSTTSGSIYSTIKLSGDTNTIIENNTISTTTNGISSTGSSVAPIIRGTNITSTLSAINVSGATTNLQITKSRLNSTSASAIETSAAANIFVNDSILDGLTNSISARSGSSGSLNITNTTIYKATSFNAASTLAMYVYNYVQVNLTRINISSNPLTFTVMAIRNDSLHNFSIPVTSGFSSFVPLLQYMKNYSIITPAQISALYAIRNSSATYYVYTNFTLTNATTLVDVPAENPTVNIQINHTNVTIYNYNYGQQYTYTKEINITAYNSTIANPSLHIFETQSGLRFYNSSVIINNCSIIYYQTSCVMSVNITLNTGISPYNSDLNFTLNYTQRDGTIISRTFLTNVDVREYAQIGFNMTDLVYNQTLNSTKIYIINVRNIGSASTGTLNIRAINSSGFITFYDGFDDAITSLPAIGQGGNLTVKVHLTVTNYSEANYIGGIEFASASINQTLPFNISVQTSVTASFNLTQEHNITRTYAWNITNGGNVPLRYLAMTYTNDTLPPSWLSYNTPVSNSSTTNFFLPNESLLSYVNINIPTHQDPGVYTGTFTFTTIDGLNQNITVTITVPVNRSWSISPTQINETYGISDNSLNEGNLSLITIQNHGNVALNMSAVPILTGYGDMDFLPQSKFLSVAGQSGTLAIPTLDKNTSYEFQLLMKSYVINDLTPPKTNMGLRINITLENSTNAANSSLICAMIVSIVDEAPQIGNWRLGTRAISSDGFPLEINKLQAISAFATDDGNKINTSTAYFTVTNGGVSTNYSPTSLLDGRYTLETTPNTSGNFTITFNVRENVVDGEKLGSGSRTFDINPKPLSVIVSNKVSNRITTNYSNKTDDFNVTRLLEVRVNGNVSIYNATIYAVPPTGWSSNTTSFSAITQNNTNVATEINITIPKGTIVGNYTFTIYANYTNPDYTNGSSNTNTIVEVLPNSDLILNISQNLSQEHSTNTTYTLHIEPRGNSNATFNLSTSNTTYTVQFFTSGAYATTATDVPLLTSITSDILMRIIVPVHSSANNTFNIIATTTRGRTFTIPITLTIPTNRTYTISTTTVNKSVVAGDVIANESLFNITNTGNTPLTFDFNTTGNITQLSLYSGAGIFYPASITVSAGSIAAIKFNYTAPTISGTFTGAISVNSSGLENNTINLTLNTYGFQLSANNFTGTTGASSGDQISLIVNLLKGTTFISENVTFTVLVDSSECSDITSTPLILGGDPNFRLRCLLPSKADGYNYTAVVRATYTGQDVGTVSITSADTEDVEYADITEPTITNVTLTSTQASTSTLVNITGIDNIAITDVNSESYIVQLLATQSSTHEVTTFDFSRVLGSPGTFEGTVYLSNPDQYTYTIHFVDPSENTNDSYEGSFWVYQYKNFTSTIQYENDSGATVGANVNITLTSATNVTRIYVVNGSLNTTTKTGEYELNLTDKTSILSLDQVDLNDLPSNNMITYGQLKQNDYITLSQQLFSALTTTDIFNGFYFAINDSTYFSVRYNFTTYEPSSKSGLKAFACINYTIGADPLTACSGGFTELTRSVLSSVQNYAVFDSPVTTTANVPVAVVFFTYVVIGQPAAAFSTSSINVTLYHNQTTTLPFSITSVLNAQQGGLLTGITFDCLNTSGLTDPCNLMYVSSFSLASLSQGLTQPFSITVRSPLGISPGTYTGTIRYKSNLNTSTPLLNDIPLIVTILPTTSYTYSKVWPFANVPISAGANSSVLADTFTFVNTGNSAVPLSFTTNGTLLSNSSLIIPIGETVSYELRFLAQSTLDTKKYSFNFGTQALSYTLETNNLLNITNVTPATNIVPTDELEISFDLYENGLAPANIIQNSTAYIDSYSITIDNITCASSIGTAIFDTLDSDVFYCTAPTQSTDKDTYLLQLNVTRNGVLSTRTYTVLYRDLLAPAISNVRRINSYLNQTNVSFALTDRSGINITSMRAAISVLSSGATVATFTGAVSQNSSSQYTNGLFNTSASTFIVRYNFTAPEDYEIRVTYCDVYNNCNNLTQNISHYPFITFVPQAAFGPRSSIISSTISQSASAFTGGGGGSAYNREVLALLATTVNFYRPNTTDVVFDAVTSSSTGTSNVSTLQNRTYDVRINSTRLDLTLYGVSYNGSQVLAFERLNNSPSTTKLAINFEAPLNYSATITYRIDRNDSLDYTTGVFDVCSYWDYSINACYSGNLTTGIAPASKAITATEFIYTLNITHFSAYILKVSDVLTTTTTTTTTGSSGSSGGGGGGGASITQIADLLNNTVGNLSKMSSNIRDDIRADIPRIEQNLYPGESVTNKINLVNAGNESRAVYIEITPEIESVVTITPMTLTIPVGSTRTLDVNLHAFENFNQTNYQGAIKIHYVDQVINIPVLVRLLETPRQPASISTSILTPTLNPTGTLRLQSIITYPYVRTVPAKLTYTLNDQQTGNIVYSDSIEINLSKTVTFNKEINLSNRFKTGNYYIKSQVVFSALVDRIESIGDTKTFTISESFFFLQLFRINDFQVVLWHIILIMAVLLTTSSTYLFIRKKLEQRKRYHLPVDYHLLPQAGPNTGYLGYVAETNVRAIIDFDSLKMHTLVAGSTGGGKSFAAQVIVEEALKNNVAVVVFDPTAQWSGFLRKNTSEQLLKLYSKFGMNAQKDPRSFKGNIRRVENPLEIITLKEYLKPGEITIFDCHKMTFEQIDLFVANTVSQVFMAELEESRDLKLLMCYDEVHRLLPKFGGSGAGFMQVERACREFRKWGIGVLLISQVLSDFIGQIKANINTEIQMRTRDEEDLKRLALKYGDELLHAVVKAEVGTGMIQNSKFNKGRPYLISMRPVLHAVERLTEQELKNYDQYNILLETIKDSLEQLEVLKVDTLDLRIELDLAYDKLKEGKFDVVVIYVEELQAKVKAFWTKLKKTPLKREKKLLDKKTVDHFLELAKKQHYDAIADAQNQSNNVEDAQRQNVNASTTSTTLKSDDGKKKDKISVEDKKINSKAVQTPDKPEKITTPAVEKKESPKANTNLKINDTLTKLNALKSKLKK